MTLARIFPSSVINLNSSTLYVNILYTNHGIALLFFFLSLPPERRKGNKFSFCTNWSLRVDLHAKKYHNFEKICSVSVVNAFAKHESTNGMDQPIEREKKGKSENHLLASMNGICHKFHPPTSCADDNIHYMLKKLQTKVATMRVRN